MQIGSNPPFSLVNDEFGAFRDEDTHYKQTVAQTNMFEELGCGLQLQESQPHELLAMLFSRSIAGDLVNYNSQGHGGIQDGFLPQRARTPVLSAACDMLFYESAGTLRPRL